MSLRPRKTLLLVGCSHNPTFLKRLIEVDSDHLYVVIDCYPGPKELESFLAGNDRVICRVAWCQLETKCMTVKEMMALCVLKGMESLRGLRGTNCGKRSIAYRNLSNLDMIFTMAQRTLLNSLCFSDLVYKVSMITEFWLSILEAFSVSSLYFASVPHSFSDFILLECAYSIQHVERILVVNKLYFAEYGFLLEYRTKRYIVNTDRDSLARRSGHVSALIASLLLDQGWKHSYGQNRDVQAAYIMHQKRQLLSQTTSGNLLLLTGLHQRACAYDSISCDTGSIAEVKDFIYFPLHYQPEASTNPLGMPFADQRIAVRFLRAMFPKAPIVIKEHPMSFLSIGAVTGPTDYIEHNLGFRSRDYYNNLLIDDNIFLADRQLSSKVLVDKASRVAGINGTELLRAILTGTSVSILSKLSPLHIFERCGTIPIVKACMISMMFDVFCHDNSAVNAESENAKHVLSLMISKSIKLM